MIELISVHIPKTAGTAFRHVLTDIYGLNGVLGDYPPDQIHQPEKPIQKEIKVIHGHFEPSKYQGYFPAAKSIVWLRHPLFRLISEYFFAKTIKDRNNVIHTQLLDGNLTILEFAQIPQMRNFLSQKIEGMELAKFDFVGIQEFYLLDLEELKDMMGWSNFQPITKNSNRYPQYQKCLQEILNDALLMDRLSKLNKEDMELYRDALHLRAKRRQESPILQSTLADWQRSQFLIQQMQTELAEAQSEIQQNRYWFTRYQLRHHNLELNSASKTQTTDNLIGFHFDSPQSLITIAEQNITLSGWVIGRQFPASKIIIMCGKDIIAETPVNLSRPDVAQVYQLSHASNSGFSIILATSAIPRQTALTIAVVLNNGETIKIGEIN
jgi:hypothetical protein